METIDLLNQRNEHIKNALESKMHWNQKINMQN